MSKTYKPYKEVQKFKGKNKRRFRREKLREKEFAGELLSNKQTTYIATEKDYDLLNHDWA